MTFKTELQGGPAHGQSVEVEPDSVLVAVDHTREDGSECWHEYVKNDAGKFMYDKTCEGRRFYRKLDDNGDPL